MLARLITPPRKSRITHLESKALEFNFHLYGWAAGQWLTQNGATLTQGAGDSRAARARRIPQFPRAPLHLWGLAAVPFVSVLATR